MRALEEQRKKLLAQQSLVDKLEDEMLAFDPPAFSSDPNVSKESGSQLPTASNTIERNSWEELVGFSDSAEDSSVEEFNLDSVL